MSHKGYFRQLRLLHTALLVGQLIFAGLIFYLTYTMGAIRKGDDSLERILQVVAVLLSIACLVIGYKRYNGSLRALRSATSTPLEERIMKYRVATIQWWALLEMPALFSLVGYFITGNIAFLILALFHTMVFAMSMPKKEVIALLLNLNQAETAQLEE